MTLTHFDPSGRAHMVDVSDKSATDRTAIAEGHIVMRPGTLALVTDGTADKGDVLGIARIAGIMGAKRTADLIPLCHPLALSKVSLDLVPDDLSFQTGGGLSRTRDRRGESFARLGRFLKKSD